MYRTADIPGVKPFHRIQRIFCSVTAVNDKREFFFSRHFQLPLKPVDLFLVVLFVPVIVQTDLTYCHRLFHLADLMHPSNFLFVQCSHIIRMYTHRTIDIWISFHQIQSTVPAFYFRAYIDHSADALRRQGIQQFFSVFIKSLIIIMCMTFKYHVGSLFLADLCACRHLLFRNHQREVAVRIFRT